MAVSTSFNKRVKAKIRHIPGTKPSLYNNQLLVSTGIPSLDAVLGGGLAVGTVLLVEEDLHATYAQLMVKYFLAEGVVSGHALSAASADIDPDQLIQDLPAPIDDVPSRATTTSTEQTEAASQGSGDADNKMSIAWRYQNQPKVQPAPTAQFGHYYNLTKRMEAEKVNGAGIDCLSFTDLLAYEREQPSSPPYTSCRYKCVLHKIRKRIEDGKFSTAVKSGQHNILRIAIHSLGSPLWGDGGSLHNHGEDNQVSLLQFLLALRATLRTAFSVCLLTVPSHLFQDAGTVKRVERLCDTVLRLESFAGSGKAKNPAFRDYTGLLHLIKLPCLNEFVSRMPETLDLAFRVRRKKFTIEKLHLPPELSDTASREQDDPVPSLRPSLGCSSSATRSSKLDF
ncbi:elongator complex protein 4-like [Littorina saxatilis]|uniref:Elongator complex protein 4 n=1 Tax=Littorina saxatilis TaxID=31220 RepID=A0AAN9B7U5_9CAEN